MLKGCYTNTIFFFKKNYFNLEPYSALGHTVVVCGSSKAVC